MNNNVDNNYGDGRLTIGLDVTELRGHAIRRLSAPLKGGGIQEVAGNCFPANCSGPRVGRGGVNIHRQQLPLIRKKIFFPISLNLPLIFLQINLILKTESMKMNSRTLFLAVRPRNWFWGIFSLLFDNFWAFGARNSGFTVNFFSLRSKFWFYS